MPVQFSDIVFCLSQRGVAGSVSRLLPENNEREGKMNVLIKLSNEEVKTILISHVEKEVPVHTAGKAISAIERYGRWEISIDDLEEN